RETVDFNPGLEVFNLTSNGLQDIFIQKLDQNGNFIWAKQIGGSGIDEARSIAIDGEGYIYVTGHFSETVDFNPGVGEYNITSNGNTDIFIEKLDLDGNFVWAKRMGGTSEDRAYSITVGQD